MIAEVKGAKLLQGFRGKPPADVDALADALVRVSHLAVHLEGKLAELDVNPLMVLREGDGVSALDALMVLRLAAAGTRRCAVEPDRATTSGSPGSSSAHCARTHGCPPLTRVLRLSGDRLPHDQSAVTVVAATSPPTISDPPGSTRTTRAARSAVDRLCADMTDSTI